MLRLLSKARFEAAYAAMVTLNNVGAVAHIRIPRDEGGIIHIREYLTGEINVYLVETADAERRGMERYLNQSAFLQAHQGI